ncbi:MAG: hypothetical protein V3S04_04505 [Candidatus Omnitrophota bacterium]
MLKFVIAVVAAILLAVFTIQNIEQVEVQLPFVQNAFRIRLIYLLFTTFILGCISTYLLLTAHQWNLSKKKKKTEAEKDLDEYL